MRVRVAVTELLGRVPERRSALAVLALCLGAATATLSAGPPRPLAGRIEGTVRLTGTGGPPLVSGAYPSRRVSRPAAAGSEVSNVIVFVKDPEDEAPVTPMRLRMVQQDEAFSPRVLAITRGSVVEFPNADPFFHNVFSLSRTATFDLGRFPRGEARARTFTHAGLVKVFCHIHSHMSAVVRVFDHPWFTIPDEGGEFSLGAVPAGEHTLVAWHERIGERRERITIRPGQVTTISFTLPVLEPVK